MFAYDSLRPGEKGDLEIMWDKTHGPQAIAKREQKARRLKSRIKRLRKNGYGAWLCSLQRGDEVVMRFPWNDKDSPGGERARAWVRWVQEDRFYCEWMRFGGDAGIAVQGALFFKPFGGGSAYHRVEHPTREVIYSGDLGYVFRDEWEDWKRRKAAWVTRRANKERGT